MNPLGGTFFEVLLHSASTCLGQLRFLMPRLFQGLIDAEAGRPLSWRELLESLQVLGDDRLCWYEQKHTIGEPLAIERGGVQVSSLIWIASQIEELWGTQADKWIKPYIKPVASLLQEMSFPLVHPYRV